MTTASEDARAEAALALVASDEREPPPILEMPHSPRGFHASMAGYRATPLRDAPHAARRLGVGEVLVKDESERLGLPSFKVLGASWAIHRALVEHLGATLAEIPSFERLREEVANRQALELLVKEAKPISVEQAKARDKLWTPGADEPAGGSSGELWTPGS